MQALHPSAELSVPTRSVGMGLCGIPYCLAQFLHYTIWHSASEIELPLPVRVRVRVRTIFERRSGDLRVRVRVRVGVRTIFERRSGDLRVRDRVRVRVMDRVRTFLSDDLRVRVRVTLEESWHEGG